MWNKVKIFVQLGIWLKNLNGKLNISGFTKSVRIGSNSTFYDNTIIEVAIESELFIGDNFTLSYGSIISCKNRIIISDNVMIGEFTSIRDSSHNYKEVTKTFNKQGDYYSEIYIGNNVWIGRGTIVFPGAKVNDNVIVGANSVVKGELQGGFIYAGNPLRKIKQIY